MQRLNAAYSPVSPPDDSGRSTSLKRHWPLSDLKNGDRSRSQVAAARSLSNGYSVARPARARQLHDGALETIVEVPGRPSGLGWRPDGDKNQYNYAVVVGPTGDISTSYVITVDRTDGEATVDCIRNRTIGTYGCDTR